MFNDFGLESEERLFGEPSFDAASEIGAVIAVFSPSELIRTRLYSIGFSGNVTKSVIESMPSSAKPSIELIELDNETLRVGDDMVVLF